jgi:hypothetical protein
VHTITKVLIVVNLVVCLVLTQYVWISLAGNVQWREKYEYERTQRHQDKITLEKAYDELLAVRASNQHRMSQQSGELAGLNATKQTLQAWQMEAELAASDAENMASRLEAATSSFSKIYNAYATQVVDRLQQNLAGLAQSKAEMQRRRGDQLLAVAQAHDDYAGKSENYRKLEHHGFLLSEELERRIDQQARYRWLRPDIQKELGDNGPVIFAEVSWSLADNLQLNKGKRDGVQRHQKFTISRGGSTIAVVDVVDVQNETCECVVIDLVNPKVMPKAGDDAVTRLFMARMGR